MLPPAEIGARDVFPGAAVSYRRAGSGNTSLAPIFWNYTSDTDFPGRCRHLLRRALRTQPHDAVVQTVQRVDVRLGRRNDDVGVGAQSVHDAAALLETHGDLALRVGAARDRIHRIEQKARMRTRHSLDRLEH